MCVQFFSPKKIKLGAKGGLVTDQTFFRIFLHPSLIYRCRECLQAGRLRDCWISQTNIWSQPSGCTIKIFFQMYTICVRVETNSLSSMMAGAIWPAILGTSFIGVTQHTATSFALALLATGLQCCPVTLRKWQARVAFGCKGDRSTPVAGVLRLGEGPPQVDFLGGKLLKIDLMDQN